MVVVAAVVVVVAAVVVVVAAVVVVVAAVVVVVVGATVVVTSRSVVVVVVSPVYNLSNLPRSLFQVNSYVQSPIVITIGIVESNIIPALLYGVTPETIGAPF